MVVSRSDSKRRKKEEVDSLKESPKRTKVHAQRKFAQGSHLNSPVLTPVKDKDKTKYNGAVSTAELLPIKRPKTEQFVNFLCFRGSDMLPKSLEFFNEPSIPEPLAGEEENKREGPSTSGGSSRAGHRSNERHLDQASGVAKAEARNKNRSKSATAVQALKKKYQEQRMNKEKRTLTKLALKAKGKNMMRTRSAGPLEEKPAAAVALQKKSVRTTRLVTSVKTKAGPSARKPVLRKPVVVKRVPSKSPITRGGLRSGGGLPPGSDEGLKTERKPRKIIKMKSSPLKKSVKKTAIASSLSDFSSDDDQPLVKKQRVISKASILASRVRPTTRSRLMSKPSSSQITSSRPPRKTKEAATLFMEMLKKDLRSPDEEEDNVDAMSVDSFEDTPKRTERRGSKDSTENVKSEKKSPTKTIRKETKPNENKLPVRNNRKLPEKPASRLTSLKTRTLRRNSYRLVAKEIELKRLKTSRAKLLDRMSSRSSSKDKSQDSSNEMEKTVSKGLNSDRDNRRERRTSSNPSKAPGSKVKQQKTVTKESESSFNKVSKKKAPETTFDDSDEEPLGKKVNQINTVSTPKVVKKAKTTSDKEETSHSDKAEFLEQKLTRRRSVNTPQDLSKEDTKQPAQSIVRAQQTSKNSSCSSENESSEKVKPESTIKPKVCDNDHVTPNTKAMGAKGVGSETSTSATQKLKENLKNTVQSKAQIEKKVKKSSIKGNEAEKSQEDGNIMLEKKKQANKTVKKSDTKKSLEARGNELDVNLTSKDVSEIKSSTDNISKNEVAPPTLQISKDNHEKSCNSGKIPSKKSTITSGKGPVNAKNKSEPTTSAVSDKVDADNGTQNCIEEPNKVTPSEECLFDYKDDEVNKNNNKLVLENINKTMQTKFNKFESDENISSSSKSPGNSKKKPPSTKKISLNECSNTVSAQTINKNETKDSDESFKSSSLKGNQEETDINKALIIGKSDQKSLVNTIGKVIEVGSLCSIMSQDVSVRVSSSNNKQNQIPSSALKIEKTDKDEEVLQPIQNVLCANNFFTTENNNANVVDKSNGNNSNRTSINLVSTMKNDTEDASKNKNIVSHDSNNKTAATEPSSVKESIIVNSKSNEIAVCSKNFSRESEPIPGSMAYSGGNTTLLSSNSNMLENKNMGLKDITESREGHPLQVTAAKQQPAIQQFPSSTFSDEKFKSRSVVLEPTLNKNVNSDVKSLPSSHALIPSDFKGKITEQQIIKDGAVKVDGKKLAIKEDKLADSSSKLVSLDMSDKISSAVETLMSLKNVQKIDDKSFTVQTGGWSLKSGQTFEQVEHKRIHETDFKRPNESEPKHLELHDSKKMKKEGEVKRVTIQEPEFKRFNVPDADNKRSTPHESEFRRYHIQDHKPKPEHPQVLKGCSNPKSMLKPGTLIDIAGISHSPEIMTPLRPGVDGEIIPMNRPIRSFGQEIVDPYKASVQGFKPYEPRAELNSYGCRWQSSGNEKTMKPEQMSEKDINDSKSKTPVNESAWRQAFKNVKDPKSSNNVPTEKPAVKKQLSVTALAKKHKSKSEVISEKNMQSQSSTSIPFLRQNKPFLGPSPTKTKDAGSGGSDVKKSSSCTEVDPASLRAKEAEVEEFLRQCGEYSRSLAPPVTHVTTTTVKAVEDVRVGNVKPPYLPVHVESSNPEEISVTPCEQIGGHETDVRYPPKPLSSHYDQSDAGPLFPSDSGKRANSPLKFEKRQTSSGLNSLELSPYGKSNVSGMVSQQDQLTKKQSSMSSLKQDQSLNIFQIDAAKRSNSPKSFMQSSPFTGIETKSKLDDYSFSSSSSPVSNAGEQVTIASLTVGTQQTSAAVNAAKISLHDKVLQFSPIRSSQNLVPDNLFKDSNLAKRTKSPTFLDSPKGNSISRNTNSPVFGKGCTTNIFKEIVPAKRSYSPTLLSTTQSDGGVPNVFSQNPNFKRSVSPLSNRSGFSKLGTNNDNTEPVKNSALLDQKKGESGLQDALKISSNVQLSVSSVSTQSSIEQQSNSPAVNQNFVPVPNEEFPSNKVLIEEKLTVKEEVVEIIESKSDNLIGVEDNTSKLDIKPFTQGVDEKLPLPFQENENVSNTSEAKHRLPLAVEQTLKKLGQTRSPQNKKPSPPQKIKLSEQSVTNIQSKIEDVSGQGETINANLRDTQSVFVPKLATGIYSHNQEGELDLMQKKKVNMSAEEIKRWLNDSSISEVEHRSNCGILENNTCECEYRNTLTSNLQNIDTLPKFETISKNESMCKSVSNQVDRIETKNKTIASELNSSTAEIFDVRHSFGAKEKEEKDSLKEIKTENLYSAGATSVSKQDSSKSYVTSSKNTSSNQMKDDGPVSIKNFCVPLSVGSSENIKQPPTTPPASKLRTFRLPNKNVDVEPKPTTLDIMEVTPARDDASSSNDLSSSNEETPEKSHSERKSIFHQRRSALKVKERRELPAPSVNAFSPENESSVYAFDPELPPTSTPFRRSKGKDGKSTCTTTDDEEMTPNSNSIAVQVNFDNEAVLECSTQTDIQEGDDDDTHTFYIPLQQSAADTNKPPLIQGVAVKVDTEGPDQKVIMRAKLVTKPLSSFNQSSSSSRGLIGTRSGKPEQKVRPLSVKPPVGTVQPTARPKPKPVAIQDDQPGPSKASTTCSPQAARLAKRIKSKAAVPSTSAENHPPKVPPAKLVEAPTFYPTEKEFEDPLEYISSITPQAEKYGLCRVVPPSNFKPECKVSDDMRFTAYNQYIHKTLHRWGPNVKEMLAIKKYLATQSIALTHPPWIGGMEVDLPRLYQTVQQCGGLKEVIEKKRWHRVADLMKIPKSAQDRVTKLDDIYCKFLLPYDTLSHVERTQLFEGVELDWIEREKRVTNQQESSATDEDDDSDGDSDSDIDECIVKGRSMALSGFYRIARNTMSMWFPKTDTPSAADVELEFWKHVASRQHHVCVHSGSIDSGAMGYGFPTGKNSSTSRHPWNLKMLTNNPGSILRFLGPIMGVTVPTLHVGMLFSACCWYRDPHGLPWIEYLHTGASKIWYGIPDSSSSQFRDAVMSIVPRLCRDKTLWLASDTAMVPPPLLVEQGVSLSRIVQDPGQFIIVFPKAFTSSICTGYVVSESVYFAQTSWLSTAQTLFNDLRESSEPTVFSLEKLLFSIVNDSRASVDVLNQILGIVVSLRDGEVAGRRQLEELGLNTSERLNSKRKGKARPASDGEEDLECEECRMTLYISWMSNSQDGAVYCLPHAVELLSKKHSLAKHCTLVYAFSEEELEELVEKLKTRVENKNQKKSVAKSSKS